MLASVDLATGPRLLAVDRGGRLVTRSVSIVPRLRNVLVLVLRYGVAVETAFNPDRHLRRLGLAERFAMAALHRIIRNRPPPVEPSNTERFFPEARAIIMERAIVAFGQAA